MRTSAGAGPTLSTRWRSRCWSRSPIAGRSSCSSWATRSMRTRFRRRHWSSSTRDGTRPGLREEVADFRGVHASTGSHGDPVIRWLFSTTSISIWTTTHDMHDDWNISRSWLEEMRRQPWWQERVVGGLMSYWIYQFIGNLSPRSSRRRTSTGRFVSKTKLAPCSGSSPPRTTASGRQAVELLPRPRLDAADRDGFTDRAELEEGHRSIFDEDEWDWIRDKARGDFDHLLIGTWIPTCWRRACTTWRPGTRRPATAPGARRRGVGERIGALDCDHWGAFQRSFMRLTALLEEVGWASAAVLGLDLHPLRRCPPRVSSRGGVPPRREREQRRLPGGLLSVPEGARRARATCGANRSFAPHRSPRPRPRPSAGVEDPDSGGASPAVRTSTTR